MLRYDPEVIEEMARSLNRQAVEVQFVRPALYLAVGLLLGLIVALLRSVVGSPPGWLEVLSPRLLLTVPPAVLGAIGYLRGREEARELRFRAHTALCQVEIEKHLERIARRHSD